MLELINNTRNCWDELRETELPIFIYGMGDGALKIMSVMERYHIPVAGFFASDEFVRGHYFEQHKVHTLSEIEGLLDDFVIVLAFAAGYPSLTEKINNIAKRHPLYAPDVPVAGDGLFTYEYCMEYENELRQVYNLLADEQSKKVFTDVIKFKITGKIQYLNRSTTSKDEIYQTLLPLSDHETYVDLGAYNGDTAEEFLNAVQHRYDSILALEPDRKNFRKLCKTLDGVPRCTTLQAAAWQEDTTLFFANKAGRMSSLAPSGNPVEARSVDSLLGGKSCTILKMDVEGSERPAILGAQETIRNFSPKLMISAYHRNEDLFSLPLLIHQLQPSYKLYLRHHLYIPAWETNLYAVPAK